MGDLLPKGRNFELAAELEVESAKGKKVKSNIYKALSEAGECVGWGFNCQGPGFADKIELVVAVDKNLETIAGFDCLASNETPGFGDRIKQPYYRNQFAGVPAEKLVLAKTGDPERIDSEIVAITGATVSSVTVKIMGTSLGPACPTGHSKGMNNMVTEAFTSYDPGGDKMKHLHLILNVLLLLFQKLNKLLLFQKYIILNLPVFPPVSF